jgi:heme A synthase
LTALVVLLQGLWAGLFLRYDGQRDKSENWINVHALGSHAAFGLAVLSAAWAVWKLRTRRDLVVGAIALAVLLFVEGYIGGLIVDSGKDALTAVHVPIAMALMAVSVWLPLRARSGRA